MLWARCAARPGASRRLEPVAIVSPELRKQLLEVLVVLAAGYTIGTVAAALS